MLKARGSMEQGVISSQEIDQSGPYDEFSLD